MGLRKTLIDHVSLSVGQRVRKRVSVYFVDFIFQKKTKAAFSQKETRQD